MMDQELQPDPLLPFHCLECHRQAHLPVVTRCGHLYCWKCFHLKTLEFTQCPLCKEPLARADIYPLFIENEHLEADDPELPDRPPPTNTSKIINSDIISSRNQQLGNNIAMGRPVAGTLFGPSLGVNAWSHLGDPQEGDPEKSFNFCLKCIFLIFLALLAVTWGLYLLL